MNNIDYFDDSPNGYNIIGETPKGVDEAIKYYMIMLERYNLKKYPVEFGIVNYYLAMELFGDKGKNTEDRAKRIENSLYYFNQCITIFTSKDYPVMYAISCIFIGKLFRERSGLTTLRSFLSDRSSPEESIHYGIDQLLESIPVFINSRQNHIEYALACLELGYLYTLQSEFDDNIEDNVIREQGITYLDRAITLVQNSPEELMHINKKGKSRVWKPKDITTFPMHIRLLIEGNPFQYIQGLAIYLTGRIEQGWGFYLTADVQHRKDQVNMSNEYLSLAFEHFCQCVKSNKYLLQSHPLWADAHHRAALLIIKHPILVDPDYATGGQSDIYLDSAISHMKLALRCVNITKPVMMDIHFHLAQAYMTRLQIIIDNVPFGESITRSIIQREGIELMDNIEYHLKEALQRVTAANTQSVQDAYLYFFTCLKLAEYRMLQAACSSSLAASGANNDRNGTGSVSGSPDRGQSVVSANTLANAAAGNADLEREDFLRDCIAYIVDACIARPLPDNMDLHYIATSQLGQILLSVKRVHGASKAYAKILFCLSAILNRAIFNQEIEEYKLKEDIGRHVNHAIYTSLKDIKWVKLHLGPTLLHERVAAGYASWSFEDIPSSRFQMDNQDSYLEEEEDVSHHNQEANMTFKPNPAALPVLSMDPNTMVNRATPPKGVPPLALPGLFGSPGADTAASGATGAAGLLAGGGGSGRSSGRSLGSGRNFKKVYITGEEIPDHVMKHALQSTTDDHTFLPPKGAVPIFAMGHKVTLGIVNKAKSSSSSNNEKKKKSGDDWLTTEYEDRRLPNSPYVKRLRLKVPPLRLMQDIEKMNRIAFGLKQGKVAYLLPTRSDQITKKKLENYHKGKPTDTLTVNSAMSDMLVVMKDKANEAKRQIERQAKIAQASMSKGNSNGDEAGNPRENEEEDDDEDNDNQNQDEEEESHENDGDEENEEGSDGQDAVQAEEEVEEDSASDDSEEGNKKNVGRPRSTKIRKQYASAGPPSPEQKKGVFSWFFKSKADKYGVSQTTTMKPQKRSILSSIFGSKKKKPVLTIKPPPKPVVKADGNNPENLSDRIGFWASKTCFYTFMVLSRQSRMDMIIRSKTLDVLTSERVCNAFYHMKASYIMIYEGFMEKLLKDCANLITTPKNLKELSQLSMEELGILFRSNAKLVHNLDDFEHFVYNKLSKFDIFLPMIYNVPIFTRDIANYDDALLHADVLLKNIFYEKALVPNGFSSLGTSAAPKLLTGGSVAASVMSESVVDGKAGPVTNNHNQKSVGFKDTVSVVGDIGKSPVAKPMKKPAMSSGHTSVVSRDKSLSVVGSGANGAIPVLLTDEERQQQVEEKEDYLVGKMTYALSQIMDGSNYIRQGQQGSKDMLMKYLGYDECMLIWSLPSHPNQNVSVVIVWREDSLSLHDHYSSTEAISERLHEERNLEPLPIGPDGKVDPKALKKRQKVLKALKKKKDRERSKFERERAKHYNKEIKQNKQQSKENEKIYRDKNGKEKSVGAGRGIVMEYAKCDLEANMFLQYLQRYLDAFHCEPLSKRLPLMTDALRTLSCALSLSEILLMLPLTIRSIVVCCPPVMRLVPWHLLLIEVPKKYARPYNPTTLAAEEEDERVLVQKAKDSYHKQKKKQDKTTASEQGFFSLGGLLGKIKEENEEEDQEAKARQAEAEKIIEIHALERYCIRLGPTLTLFEMTCAQGTQLRHVIGDHRMVCIDGDDHMDQQSLNINATAGASSNDTVLSGTAGGGASSPIKKTIKRADKAMNAGGIRGADLEIASCASTFSGDPTDYTILSDQAASSWALETVDFHDSNIFQYSKFKQMFKQKFYKLLKKYQPNSKGIPSRIGNNGIEKDSESDKDEETTANETEEQRKKRVLLKKRHQVHLKKQKKYRNRGKENSSSSSSSDDDEEDEDENSVDGEHEDEEENSLRARQKLRKKEEKYKKKMKKQMRSQSEVDDEDDELYRQTHYDHAIALTTCRILHISAHKSLLPHHVLSTGNTVLDGRVTGSEEMTGLILPQGMDHKAHFHHPAPLPQQPPQHLPSSNATVMTGITTKTEYGSGGGGDGSDLTGIPRVLTAKQILQQLYLKNCGLCILSKYGITDDIHTVTATKTPITTTNNNNHKPSNSAPNVTHAMNMIEKNWELIESFHFAGVSSVLFPLWEGSSQGIGTLAHILFLLRFYSLLPAKANDRLSVIETCRRVQLWLKTVNANETIAFLHKAPIPKKAKELLIAEMESYVTASVSVQQGGGGGGASKTKSKNFTPVMERIKSQQRNSAEQSTTNNITTGGGGNGNGAEDGVPEEAKTDQPMSEEDTQLAAAAVNRIGGDKQFFTHFLHWGSFIVSGYCGNIHHPALTTEDNEDEALFGTKHQAMTTDPLALKDTELDNMEFEIMALRMEGKLSEALELEKYIRHVRTLQMKHRLQTIQQTGWRAGRGILDTINYLDKTFLDQDSDSVDVSSEEDGPKKPPKMTESDDTTANPIMSGAGEGSESSPANEKLKKKVQLPTDEEREIAYAAWRSKVSGLTMDVKQPELLSEQAKKQKLLAAANNKANPKSKDNYEYQMQQSVKVREKQENDHAKKRLFEDEDEKEDDDEVDGEGKGKGEDSSDDEAEKKLKRELDDAERRKGFWKDIWKDVRTYREIAEVIAEKPEKEIQQLKKEYHIEKPLDQCIIQ